MLRAGWLPCCGFSLQMAAGENSYYNPSGNTRVVLLTYDVQFITRSIYPLGTFDLYPFFLIVYSITSWIDVTLSKTFSLLVTIAGSSSFYYGAIFLYSDRYSIVVVVIRSLPAFVIGWNGFCTS